MLVEGYWQDIAGRTTFKRGAAPTVTMGSWYARELDATYPQAKQIRKSERGFDLADLNYDDKEYSVRVLHANESSIAFVRKAGWSSCRTEHVCRLNGAELMCLLQTLCEEAGKDIVDWKGEERYIRRAHCEPGSRTEAQGIPVKCY